MSTPFRGREVPSAARQEGSPKIVPVTPPSGSLRNWPERAPDMHARHDAITRTLNTWSNYKNWAERMRSTLDQEAAGAPLQERRPGGHNPPSH